MFRTKKGQLLAQILWGLFLFTLFFFLLSNMFANFKVQQLSFGYSFLQEEAGFEIGDSLWSYSASDSYLKALWTGIGNTLKIAFIGNIGALILGLFLSICLLVPHKLLQFLSESFLQVIRNIPLLLQLFVWYALISELLPPIRQSWEFLPNVFLNKRGLYLPWFDGSLPVLKGLNFQGGAHLSPELLALCLGLIIYTSVFMAEIIKAGVLSVEKGQWEAGHSLGFSYAQTLRLIIFPQSLRVIIPPLTSQFMNLTKNSSLAVAIGYPDFVSIVNTSLNQTGRAVELIFLLMLTYLFLNLCISWIMNYFYRRVLKWNL